jgi:hypothetical protein
MLTTSLTILLLAGAAIVQDAPPMPRGGGPMMRADVNGDGAVSREEALRQAGERFDRMDLNRDGTLTPDELKRLGQRMRGARHDAASPPPAQ